MRCVPESPIERFAAALARAVGRGGPGWVRAVLVLLWAGLATAVAAQPGVPGAAPGATRVVVVGVLADQPPYQVWPAGGRAAGADIDLLEHLAASLGWAVEYRRYAAFASLHEDLLRGRIDLASSFARTPQRGGTLAFSEPYGKVEQVLVTRDADPSGTTAPDLMGRSIAVVQGFASEENVRQLFPLASRVPVQSIEEGVRAVHSGRADVLFELKPVLIATIERLGLDGLAFSRSLSTSTATLHFAAPLARRDLTEALSRGLSTLDPTQLEAFSARWQPQSRRVRLAGLDPVPQAEREALALRLARPVVAVVRRDDRPFTFGADDGSPAGLSVDLASRWLERLGAGVPSWRWMSPDDARRALGSGEVDAAIGLDERTASVRDFPVLGPFLEYPMALIGPVQGAAFDLDQLYGRRVAVPQEHVGRPLIESRHPSIRLVDCQGVQDCIGLVAGGRADATLVDVVGAANALAERPRAAVQIIGTESSLRRGHSLAVSARYRDAIPVLQAGLDRVVSQDLPELKARWLVRRDPQAVVLEFLRRWVPWVLSLALLGGLAAWLHVHRMRSEIRRTREATRAAQAARAASQRFTAFLAHEVRNSLHAVIAGAQLIEGRADGLGSLPAALGRSARGTLLLLNNLLERERLDAGRLALRPQPTSMAAPLQQVLDELAPQVLGRPVRLRLDDRTGGACYRVDALRLQQIVRNLLANAIRHSREGEVLVVVQPVEGLDAQDGAVPQLELRVHDQGSGIPAERLQDLFEPFATGGAEAGSPNGTGLGLALSRDLARLMGGDLSLDSAVGVGTTARLRFDAPLATTPSTGAGDPGPVDPASPAPPAGRLLILEDSEPYALALQAAWESAGWTVVTVGTVGAALEAFEREAFALVLSDLHLPDGLAVPLIAAAADDARHAGIPIVFMSADLEGEDVRRLRDAGARHVLVKSWDATRMRAAVLERLQAPLQAVTPDVAVRP